MLKKTPLEEKIEALASAFETVVDIILKISDTIDGKLSDLYKKVELVEMKIDSIKSSNSIQKENIPSEKVKNLHPPPDSKPEPQKFRENTDNIRRDLMNELKDIINKRKGKDLNNKK